MATEKTTTTSSTSSEPLSQEVIALLNEFMTTARQITPKRANKRSLRRTIGTLEGILADLKEEVSK